MKNPHKNVGFFMFPSFFFFLISAFFCLNFSSLPLLFDILKPKICPPDEVFGKNFALSMRVPNPSPVLDIKIVRPWAQKIFNQYWGWGLEEGF